LLFQKVFITLGTMLKLPGLIDPHVHLRTPGQEYKEDFLTGTSAALAGGYTTIIDMPNNLEPITTLERLEQKENIAKQQIVCDIGFYFGSLGNNFDEFTKVQDKVLGLKIYLNQTTGGFIVDEKVFEKICNFWARGPSSSGRDLPILVHAEENVIGQILEIGHKAGQRIHVCHVSSQKELEIVINAKMKGYAVTCGVTPHHLFLNQEDEQSLGGFGKMKPSLKSKVDVAFLWSHIADIDVIESDHAPHTVEEKMSNNPPFGIPGLETTLPLLLTAVSNKKLNTEDIIRLCHDNPKKIFLSNSSLRVEPSRGFNPTQKPNRHSGASAIESQPPVIPSEVEGSFIQIDENEEWVIQNNVLFTKSSWSPFNGWQVKGKVKKVVIRGEAVFENDEVLAKPGFGKIIKPV